MKRCAKCGKDKPAEEFSKDSSAKDGLFSWCKSCQQTYYQANQRERNLKYRYGISPEQFDQLFEFQEGKCAVCKRRYSKILHVDHDHKTRKVRGLLCRRCNTVILPAVEHTSRLAKAAEEYLADPPADHVLEEAA